MAESPRPALPWQVDFSVPSAGYRPDQRYGSAAFHMRQTQLTPEALVELVWARLSAP